MSAAMRLRLLCACAVLALPVPAAADKPPRPPVETGPPNAPDQKPAFPGQTRAMQPGTATRLSVTTVAHGLDGVWAFAFLPGGRLLVTEKGGRMRLVSPEGVAGPPVAGVPKVEARGQGGLLDLAVGPSFVADGRIYFSYAEKREGGNGTTVARARLVEEGGRARLEDVEVIFRQSPAYDGDKHFGSRLVFSGDGTLYVTVGSAPTPSRGSRPRASPAASARSSASRPTAASRPTTRSPAARTSSRPSGPTATATSRPPPSTRRAGCGPSSTGRGAATS